MKTILFAILLGITSTSFAQEKESELAPIKNSKLTFGWIYSPEVSYRMLSEGHQANSSTEDVINMRNENERAKFGQTFSLFLGYRFSKVFTLEAGLGYTDFGLGREPIDYYIGMNSDEYYATVTQSDHLHVLNVPISLNVKLGGNQIQGFISAGVAPGYMSRYTSYRITDYEDGSLTKSTTYSALAQDDFNDFILGVHLSGGIDYRYSDAASLRIAPVVRYTTNNALSPGEIKANYFNVGIEFGAIYRL
ncbi:MAG: outer membrane beta-barrel protein [Crocinitomicaceae bacterium]|nr:outer membrane beta-barrel protein [Crocinitomicaceae bacterium]